MKELIGPEIYLVCTNVMLKTVVTSAHRSKDNAIYKCERRNREYERRYKVDAEFFVIPMILQD